MTDLTILKQISEQIAAISKEGMAEEIGDEDGEGVKQLEFIREKIAELIHFVLNPVSDSNIGIDQVVNEGVEGKENNAVQQIEEHEDDRVSHSESNQVDQVATLVIDRSTVN